jgi:raffinose/stachyose/melibiose transport system substrate-binding protein
MQRKLRGGVVVKKKKWNRVLSVLLVMVTAISLLSGCGGKSAEKEDAETITVYLWSTSLYEKYAPYIQEQLPDINVEFVVGNNNLDFYKFLNENDGLPDIITCCRFSLHDASPLKDSLMDLSTTNAAGAVYDSYLSNFMNEDGSVNWIPVCADAHGFVVNKDLFEKYNIPLPTDYESFVAACQAFDKVGIRGFTADYYYDYTCMETLQGLSASELSSVDGRKWRTTYSDPDNTKREGLDSTIWPEVFERMEQFIKDTGLSLDDLDMNYDEIVEMYQSGKLAMYFGSSSGVKMFQNQGINTTFLPFFQENGEKWLMTTPYFQVALNRDLTQDETRRKKAMKVLNTMLSEDAQNRVISDGQDLLSYSQDVNLKLTEYLKDVKPVIEENHMYIRIASNDFFSASKDVVSKMISGEYDAEQAYQSFNSQLLEEESTSENIVLDSQKSYSNRFHSSGGNEAYSVMANTLRNIYGTDVLIATGNSFTGNVLKAGYTKKMAGNMIMPNSLSAYSSKMSGAELKETVRNFIEGYEGGLNPFNRGSLPVLSGISVEVKETDNGYTLSKVTKDGKNVQDNDTLTVTCLAIPKHMKAYPADENVVFEGADTTVKDTWTGYVSDGDAVLAEPEDYITLR